VLLQESPPRDVVLAMARRLYGVEAGVVWGRDSSLIVHGRVTPREHRHRNRHRVARGRARLASGLEVEVVSLHLVTQPLRPDFWNAESRRLLTETRRLQREQLAQVAAGLRAVPESVPVILGGDFNGPQGDAIFRLLRPRLSDTFPAAGRGWGNTIFARYPVLRIDQVWVSRHFRSATVHARFTPHSDHRMVVCDLRLRRE
jgi:endonuclease/exonuclease/phosphatase family metal-dependent hydrolase